MWTVANNGNPTIPKQLDDELKLEEILNNQYRAGTINQVDRMKILEEFRPTRAKRKASTSVLYATIAAKVMTLASNEFIRRFLIHVLPHSFHRIRHYGLFASAGRAENIARARQLLHGTKPHSNPTDADTIDGSPTLSHPCPRCGGRMIIIETFERGNAPHYRPAASTVAIRIDTS